MNGEYLSLEAGDVQKHNKEQIQRNKHVDFLPMRRALREHGCEEMGRGHRNKENSDMLLFLVPCMYFSHYNGQSISLPGLIKLALNWHYIRQAMQRNRVALD